MRLLVLLLIIIPASEIGILLLSGNLIGIFPTILLIILTGVIGAYLAKQQGLEAIKKAQEQLQYGEMPHEVLLDGISILVGGVLLLTPGFITDTVGFLLLIPKTRKGFKKLIVYYLRKMLDNGNVTIIR